MFNNMVTTSVKKMLFLDVQEEGLNSTKGKRDISGSRW